MQRLNIETELRFAREVALENIGRRALDAVERFLGTGHPVWHELASLVESRAARHPFLIVADILERWSFDTTIVAETLALRTAAAVVRQMHERHEIDLANPRRYHHL